MHSLLSKLAHSLGFILQKLISASRTVPRLIYKEGSSHLGDALHVTAVRRPWTVLPADVIAILLAQLPSSTVATMRLVCTTWRTSIDNVIEDLEMCAFPEDAAFLKRFPVVKSLKLVKPGMRTSNAASPRRLGQDGQSVAQFSRQDSSPAGETPNKGNSTSSHGPQATRMSGLRSLRVDVPDAGSSPQPSSPNAWPHAAAGAASGSHGVSPRTEHLSSILRELAGRQVPVRSLAVFYDGPESILCLPSTLTTLTIVRLTDAAAGAQEGGPANQNDHPVHQEPHVHPAAAHPGHVQQGGHDGQPAMPQAPQMQQAGTASQTLQIPQPTVELLQHLRELQVVNAAPDFSALAQLSQLRTLVLAAEPDSSLTGLPHKFTPPAQRMSLQLGEELEQLSHLQALVINRCRMAALPPGVSHLTHLTSLHCIDCHLPSLPPQLGSLTCLQHLVAPGNPCLQLPSSLVCLTALRHLNLSWTRANVGEIFELGTHHFTALEELRLSGNTISALPPSIKHLTGLKVLVVSMNQIEVLPRQLCEMSALNHLDCSVNHVREVEGLPPHLTRLALQNNSLVSLPEDLGRRLGSSLTWLDVSSNCLTRLPASFTKLQALRTLRLSFNQIEGPILPVLSRLPALRVLEAFFVGLPPSTTAKMVQQLQKLSPQLLVAC